MKAISELLHKLPWWALTLGGIGMLFALAVFVTPFHIIQYHQEGATPQESRAIKREIDSAFAEKAIDLARGVVRSMRDASRDPELREELGAALEGLEEARKDLREAGAEVMRAKREALDSAREAVRDIRNAVRDAKREAKRALKEDSGEGEAKLRELEESLQAAKAAESKAKKDLHESGAGRIVIGKNLSKRGPLAEIQIGEPKGPAPADPAKPADPAPPADAARPAEPAPPEDELPEETRRRIQRDVLSDMYRIGIGAALVLILFPLFLLAIIAKFFIDRSRAAQRVAEVKKGEAEFHRLSRQVTEAKLQALQAQVEPHFLYNTLASVQALIEVDPGAANAMTGHLIQYLRNALPKMRDSVSTVGQEVELVRAYLNILQLRMGPRLAFEIDVPKELEALSFPPLMLPSLVENAIKHGLEPQREGGTIRIGAERVDTMLRLRVADTGRGFGETIGTGVGLSNMRERLAGLYGAAGKLTLEENSPRGVVATLEIPIVANTASAPSAAQAPEGPAFASGVPPEAMASGSGAAASGFATSSAIPQASAPAAPRSAARKALSALASVERGWRKTLSFAFVALVVIAATAAGLGIVGVTAGWLPVQFGGERLLGPGGALIGTAGIALAFLVVVLAMAVVVAVIYGLGFLALGIAIFVPLVIAVALVPAFAPFILLGLLIWWIVRKKKEPETAPPK